MVISHMGIPSQGAVGSMTSYTASFVAGANQVVKYKVKKYKRQRKILDIRKSNSPVIDGFFSKDFYVRPC
jgi:hypothetical protein